MASELQDRLTAARDELLPRDGEATLEALVIRRRHRQVRQRTGAIAVAALLTVGAAVLIIRAFGTTDVPVQPGPASVTPTPSPEPAYLAPDERWAPAVSVEDGIAVMPLTFPEGTVAELRYDPDLRLDELDVSPSTGIVGPTGSCGYTADATRHDPALGRILGDTPPLFEHTRPDGTTVALWQGLRSIKPYDFLIFRFGAWSVVVACRTEPDGPDPQLLRTWIEGVDGHQSEDGFVVLEGTEPITLHPWSENGAEAPHITLYEPRELIIAIRVTDGCASRPPDLSVDDGVAQWCINPEEGIYVYANAWSPEAKDRLALFIESAGVDVTS